MKSVTVAQMVESLLLLDQSLPLEINVMQVNKRYAVARLSPDGFGRVLMSDTYAICRNGVNAVIEITLPSDEKSYMITSTRKI